MKPITSSRATGSFIPDSPSSERASRFSRVERRSTAKIAAESVAAIAAPTIIPSSVLRSKIHFAASPATHGGDDGPDRRQRGRRAEHRADLRPARGQAALEEDQDQRDRAQRPGQLGVVELDPADPLRAGEHPQAEEEQQAGDAHPVGEQGADDARRRAGRRRSGSARRRVLPSTDPSRPLDVLVDRRQARLELLGGARPRARPRRARAGGGRPGRAGRRGRRRRAAKPISTRRNSSPTSGTKFQPMKSGGAADPARRGAPHLALGDAGLVDRHRGEVEAHAER